jgi:hypothetical protein
MTSILKADDIQDSSGNNIINEAGDTITIGASGDTITIPSGATITNSGTASGFNTPAFQAKLGSDQTVTNDTNTKVQIDTEIFDTDNCFDNSTNYRFTPNVGGKYMVYGSVRGGADANLTNLEKVMTHIQKNGSLYESMYWRLDLRNNPGTQLSTSFSVIIDLDGSSDYIELFSNVDVSSDTPNFVSDGTFFGAYRIGA